MKLNHSDEILYQLAVTWNLPLLKDACRLFSWFCFYTASDLSFHLSEYINQKVTHLVVVAYGHFRPAKMEITDADVNVANCLLGLSCK